MDARDSAKQQAEMYVLRNVGHLATVGTPRYAAVTRRWHVPVLVPSRGEETHVGDVELGDSFRVVKDLSKTEVLARMASRPDSA